MAETLYIIDGHSQIYRAYYAPFRPLSSPAGEPTRATYVFCAMLMKFIAEKQPRYLAMAMDGPAAKLKRREVYSEYKVTRKPTPEDLHPQIRRIAQIVEEAGIPILTCEGYEADDILATAAEKFLSPEMNVVLISRDKDLDQLVCDGVAIYDPMKDETLDAAAIQAAKGYSPAQTVDVLAMIGDTSDNVPGLPGVGPKTAVKLIGEYGSLEAILANIDKLPPKVREGIQKNRSTLDLARQLITLDRHVPINLNLDAMRFDGLQSPNLRSIFRELGFHRLLEQLESKDQASQALPLESAAAEASAPAAPATSSDASAPPPVEAGQPTTASDFDYTTVETPEALEGLVAALREVKRLAVDTETTSVQPMWAELVGISLAWQGGKAVYLPVRGPLGATTLPIELVRAKLGPVLADAAILKVGQNLKYDMIVLANAGMPVAGAIFDTMVAAHVLDSSRLSYSLDSLAVEMLNHRPIPIENLLGRGRTKVTMDRVPVDMVTPYACEDADLALRVAEIQEARLAQENLDDLFKKLEMPLLPVLVEMERTGIRVDPAALKRIQQTLSRQADVLRERIISLAGCAFNPDSPRQLASVLFEKLKLPVARRGATGASTDSAVLEQLAPLHELPGVVLDYRKLTKLLSTYTSTLGECIHPRTGRVHTCFHQTGTATGRLSSSDPNLQNIPVRSEEGRQIRSAFVADEGCLLLSADYSQVEIRVLAHLCGDPTLIATFQADQDIHRTVAAEVFGVGVDEVTDEQRSRAKTVNFGIIYGQTAFGLAATLRIGRGEAGEFIKRYRERFPRIDEFLRRCVSQARDNGYVETIFRRRRRISNIDSRNPQLRALAERLAINSVVQGSAADLIKEAMVNLAARIKRERRGSRMLLQIHDELVLEVPQDAVEAERAMVVEEMAGAIKLAVPLKVETGVGPNWMAAK
ncbi:MAG: DNA polymerase I [Phycisphaerae bacterium]|jgi:DNA polymerase-1